jgi:putative ABC transport system permease protein
MTFIRLGLWLLQRERASGEWRVLLLALIIGVGSVSTTGFLGDRIKRAMSEQGASFLGADLLVTSPRPVETWPRETLPNQPRARIASMAPVAATLPARHLRASTPLIRCAAVRIAERLFGAARRARRNRRPARSMSTRNCWRC